MDIKNVKIAKFTAHDLQKLTDIDREVSINITAKSNIVDFKLSFGSGNIDIIKLQSNIDALKKLFEEMRVDIVIKGVTVKSYNKCAIITVEFPDFYSIQVV